MKKRIAHITDTHIDDATGMHNGNNPRANFEKVLAHVASQDVDEIVFTGDIGHENQGFEDTYAYVFNKLRDTAIPYKAILGNHDHFTVAMHYYRGISEGSGELYYSHEDEGYRYIYLDSSSARISPAQLAWLENELHTPKKVALFIHHPILGLNTAMDRIYPLRNREEVKRLLQERARPVTVFCGHYHMSDERRDGNILQYVTPATSFQVSKESAGIDINTDSFSYRIIDLSSGDITTLVYTDRGNGLQPDRG